MRIGLRLLWVARERPATWPKQQGRMWYPPRLQMLPRPKPQKTPSLSQLKSDLFALEDPARAHFLKGFFKCGPGEYAEGDVMLGINVPAQRKIAKKYSGLPLAQV